MHGLLRFIWTVNAAVWFGGTVFFTFAVGPAFFSAEMLSFLPRPHAGRAAEVVLARYFFLFQCCGAIALLLMLAERLFSAKKGQGLLAGMVAVLLAFGLLGKYALLPKMHQLQIIKYSPRSTQVQRQAADANFRAWHGAVQTVNLLSVAALLFLLWQSSRPPEAPRLSGWGSGSNTRGRS